MDMIDKPLLVCTSEAFVAERALLAFLDPARFGIGAELQLALMVTGR